MSGSWSGWQRSELSLQLKEDNTGRDDVECEIRRGNPEGGLPRETEDPLDHEHVLHEASGRDVAVVEVPGPVPHRPLQPSLHVRPAKSGKTSQNFVLF